MSLSLWAGYAIAFIIDPCEPCSHKPNTANQSLNTSMMNNRNFNTSIFIYIIKKLKWKTLREQKNKDTYPLWCWCIARGVICKSNENTIIHYINWRNHHWYILTQFKHNLVICKHSEVFFTNMTVIFMTLSFCRFIWSVNQQVCSKWTAKGDQSVKMWTLSDLHYYYTDQM